MGLTILDIEFEKENKEDVYKILEKKGWFDYLMKECDDWITLHFYDEVTEEDIKEFKPYCEHIGTAIYEQLEGEGVYWNNEDDELRKIVRRKLNKMEKK
jgi:hypothetical protein